MIETVSHIMDEERLWVLWAKKQTGELETDEHEELRQLIEQMPADLRPAPMPDQLWQMPLKPYPDEILPADSWNRISQVTYSSKKITRRISFSYRIAAAIAVLVMLAAAIGYYQFRKNNNGQLAQKLN
ncbi:MAG: hypothetical protein EOO05_21445, partial [Chitinophagaceae bacterium]